MWDNSVTPSFKKIYWLFHPESCYTGQLLPIINFDGNNQPKDTQNSEPIVASAKLVLSKFNLAVEVQKETEIGPNS